MRANLRRNEEHELVRRRVEFIDDHGALQEEHKMQAYTE